MIDPVAAMIALLTSDTQLVAEVTDTVGRVHIYGAPPGLDRTAYNVATGVPLQSLTVQQAGGIVARTMPTVQPLFYFLAYGQDAREASQVFARVYNVFYDANGVVRCNRLIANRWFLYWAEIESLSAPATEQQSQWPIAYASVRAKFDARRGA